MPEGKQQHGALAWGEDAALRHSALMGKCGSKVAVTAVDVPLTDDEADDEADGKAMRELGRHSPEELAAVRSIFAEADASNTGWLTQAELAAAVRATLKRGGAQFSREQAEVDPDGSELAALFDEMGGAASGGRISFREFAEWWTRGGDDVDSKFMKWWFKDAVSRSFKMRKKTGREDAVCARD